MTRLFRYVMLAMMLCLAFASYTFAFGQSTGGYSHTSTLTSVCAQGMHRTVRHRRHHRRHHKKHHSGATIHVHL